MFERDKKTEMGEGVTSLIDADMRITEQWSRQGTSFLLVESKVRSSAVIFWLRTRRF